MNEISDLDFPILELECDPMVSNENNIYFSTDNLTFCDDVFDIDDNLTRNDNEVSSQPLDNWLYNFQLSDHDFNGDDLQFANFETRQRCFQESTIYSTPSLPLLPLIPIAGTSESGFQEQRISNNSNSNSTQSEYQASNTENTSSNLCSICGNEAGKYVCYGGQACSSCRAFFRRSVQNESYKTFSCSASGSCNIDSKSWCSCRFCRYQKCLNSGMKPTWVLNDAERQVRHEKRTSNTRRKKASKHLMTSTTRLAPFSENLVGSLHSITWSFTKDEHSQILDMFENWKKKLNNHVIKYYYSNPYIFIEIIRALYQRTVVSYKAYKEMEARWLKMTSNFLTKESYISSLDPSDSSALIETNLPILRILLQSVLLGNNQALCATGMGDLLLQLLSLNSSEDQETTPEVKELYTMFKHLTVDQTLPQKTLTYDQIFVSPWAASSEVEERHKKLTSQISDWPIDSQTKDDFNTVDRLQVFILGQIFLLSTDHVSVSNMSQVSKLQDNYLTMLHRYLKFKYNREANARLASGIMIWSLAKEAQEILSHRLPV